MAHVVFKSSSPELSVRHVATRSKGRCYTVSTYEVRSTHKLPRIVFDGLREAGMLGYGQGWSVSEPTSEPEQLVPTSIDEFTGKVLAEGYEVVLNPYTRLPYSSSSRTIYVYTVTSECDSGD